MKNEKIFVFKLTETQVNNLNEFINRINLNAKEVPVFNNLMNELNKVEMQSDVKKESKKESTEV